jgi:RNA polymerase sigma-70 factor (ECF subfamily)
VRTPYDGADLRTGGRSSNGRAESIDTTAPDPAAFDEVFATERRRLFGIAFTVLRDRAEAEDAVQETMVAAWRGWDSLRDPDKRSAWLTRICLNWCFRRRIRLARVIPFSARQRDADDATSIGRSGRIVVTMSAAAAPGPRDLDLDRAFGELSPRQRAAVLLHHHFGFTVEQCAEVMSCSEGTVRSHLQRALAALREELGDA